MYLLRSKEDVGTEYSVLLVAMGDMAMASYWLTTVGHLETKMDWGQPALMRVSRRERGNFLETSTCSPTRKGTPNIV